MHGGVKFYRGSPKAARAYVEADHSRADDYYLAEGSGVATRYVAGPGGVRVAGELTGDTYEQWVAGYDITTGAAKGRLRDDPNALRFVEVTINGPKTWCLAAALHPEISAALDAAQDRAAEQIIGWLAKHATTRIGPRGRQVQVPVEQLEAAVIRHYTSRAGDPHRHLHLQINARVYAEGRWRGLHSVGVRDVIEAINGIGHAAVTTDPEFRAVLAAHGFTMNTAAGAELVELAPYVPQFSARTNQIRRNVDRYEADWRAAHPGEEPGPRLREAWDRHAWAQARPDKPNKLGPVDGAAMVAAWNRLLHDLGYRDPAQPGLPIPPTSPSVGSLDRDAMAELVIAELGAEHSAWNAADIRGRVEQHLAAAGLITDAAVRLDLAEDITARAITRCVPLIEDPGVPEHVRSLTSEHVLDVEANLVAAMAQRAEHPGHPADIGTASDSLDDAQRDAVAVLAGTGQLVVVEGAAGAGKTTALAGVRDELAREGRRMVVVTPTLKAAQVARGETGIHATSAAGLAHEFGWEWDDAGHWQQHTHDTAPTTALARGDLLLVDEAGMLDQDTALALFQIAEQTGARVALVGDRHQLPAVGRGGVLDLAARWAHPDTVVGLDVVHRFADPDYADISLAMRRGEHPAEIFDRLWERGQIWLHATEPERLHTIATKAADRIAARGGKPGGEDTADVVVVADTLAQVSVLNGIIRDQLVAHGLVDDVRVVTTNAGERIGVGDRVATRLNDRHLGVANRDQWTVTAVGADGSLTLAPAAHNRPVDRIAGGAHVRDVPAWYVATRVELAYATTVYGAQGETTGTGHMLLTETTTGSAAYVGMTRGREDNVAHLVADNIDEARAIWTGVMGRDRADLGPGHAAEQAAEEMERYTPQRPARVVLDQLHQAWTRQADLTGQAKDLARHRDDIEAVMSIRAAHEPRARELHEAARAAWEHESAAVGALRALEATIATQQRDLTTELLDHWHREHVEAYQAAAVLRAGSGRLGQHRRQVREARADLTTWTLRWQPILPDLPTEPDQIRHHLESPPPQMRGDQLRQQIADVAGDAVAHAHPEAEPIRAEAAAAQQAARRAAGAVTAEATALGEELRPYRWAHARADQLPRALAEVRRELETVDGRLRQATERVDHFLRSPEIRRLPPSTVQTEHDQWQADRAAAKEAADIAALAARAVRTRQPKPGLEPPASHRDGPTSAGLSL